MSRLSPKWRLLAGVFLLGVAADHVTKFLAVDRLTWAFQRNGMATLGQKLEGFVTLRHLEGYVREPYVVFPSWWRMSYVENPNAAFSIGSFLPPGPRYAVFLLFAAVAVGAILWFYRRLGESQKLQQLTLALVLAGAAGNVIDRLLRRYVIDFIEWHWGANPRLVWPTFNVADSLLSVGIVLLLVVPPGKGTPRAGE